jgi:hypothetical protein
LVLKVRPAEGEDVWCTCLFCELPRHDASLRRVGEPVEYLVSLPGNAQHRWSGLHRSCWTRQSSYNEPRHHDVEAMKQKLRTPPMGERWETVKGVTWFRELQDEVSRYVDRLRLDNDDLRSALGTLAVVLGRKLEERDNRILDLTEPPEPTKGSDLVLDPWGHVPWKSGEWRWPGGPIALGNLAKAVLIRATDVVDAILRAKAGDTLLSMTEGLYAVLRQVRAEYSDKRQGPAT